MSIGKMSLYRVLREPVPLQEMTEVHHRLVSHLLLAALLSLSYNSSVGPPVHVLQMTYNCLTGRSLVISPPDILLHIIIILAASILASRGASHADPAYSGYVIFSLACGNVRSGSRSPGFYS